MREKFGVTLPHPLSCATAALRVDGCSAGQPAGEPWSQVLETGLLKYQFDCY